MEKDLGVLVDEKLDVSQQCVLTAWRANSILGCIKREGGQQGREQIVPPVLCHCKAPTRIMHPGLHPLAQEGYGAVRAGPEEAMKLITEQSISPMKTG